MRDGRAPVPESDSVSRVMSANKGKDTKPELMLRQALREIGIRGYRLHWTKAPGRPDIAFPGRMIAIFVHGCYWHRCPICNPPLPKTHTAFWREKFEKNKSRDERKIQKLKGDGWRVVVIWECEIKNNSLGSAQKVKKILDNWIIQEMCG